MAAYSTSASPRCTTSRYGDTAVLSGKNPDATINHPTAPCSPPSTNNNASRFSNPRVTRPVAQNQSSGSKNTIPISRPHSRWLHSSQKMRLKPSIPNPWFTSSYCGIFWYSANRRCHSASDSGGSVPISGAHSMIDKPEPVRRVTPPKTIMTRIIPATVNSHRATGRCMCPI